MLGDNVACPLDYIAYDKVAEGYGGAGFLIGPPANVGTGDDGKAVKDAIKRAQNAAAGGTPALLNVLIGKTSFREGSISV